MDDAAVVQEEKQKLLSRGEGAVRRTGPAIV